MGSLPARYLVAICLLCRMSAIAQSLTPADTTRILDTVKIEAYASNRKPADVAAAIGLLSGRDVKRFSEASLLPAFNVIPGIRMEERSPGSYRFSIRGSLIRSPFGVRNVKFYWNGLPFTDGGGNTYLNLIDPATLSRAEIIKGPAGSLYGAGTGGAVLLRSSAIQESSAGLSAQFGSFGSIRYGGYVEAASDVLDSRVQFTRQESSGYRAQSGMNRSAFNAEMSFKIDPSTLARVSLLYTDLYYQTPGGLTQTQYQSDPKQARPAAGSIPGAVEQQAAVYNKTLFSGVTVDHQWSKAWSTTIGLAGSTTDFRNPSIRNFETRKEKNLSARISNSLESSEWLKLTFGGEYQRFSSPITVTNNAAGSPGQTVISDDDIQSQTALGFVQAETELGHDVQLTIGASVNYLEYTDQRKAVNPPQNAVRKFNPVLLPRLALLKRLSRELAAYISASRGYSPPSVAEVVPSTGIYNPTLKPETGWSYEVGVAGQLSGLDFRIALYDFRLEQAIVLQRDSSGADFFVNAGEVKQQGVELNVSWDKQFASWVRSLRLVTSVTYNHYRFGQYVYDGNDFSGNPVTGVAPWIAVIGADVLMGRGLYAQLTGTYTDRIPLNDANTDIASEYYLLGTRVGYRSKGRVPMDLYVGVDNALNQRYSLGNDLNAVGRRYYNAAPTANYYFGLSARLPFLKK